MLSYPNQVDRSLGYLGIKERLFLFSLLNLSIFTDLPMNMRVSLAQNQSEKLLMQIMNYSENLIFAICAVDR